MNTSLSEIYEAFIFKSDDFKLQSPREGETEFDFYERIELTCKVYLESAISQFHSILQSKIVEVDYTLGEFTTELHPTVKEILILRMLIEHVQKRLNFLNAISSTVRTKDFEQHSKSNEIRSVIASLNLYKVKVENLESDFDWLVIDNVSGKN